MRCVLAVKTRDAVGGIDYVKADCKAVGIYDSLCTADTAKFSADQILQKAQKICAAGEGDIFQCEGFQIRRCLICGFQDISFQIPFQETLPPGYVLV